MSIFLSRFAAIVAFALIITFSLFTPDVHAQNAPQDAFDGPVNAGTFDLSLGVGGLFYNTIEPGLDVGLVPIAEVGTISVGGYVDAGYCLLGCFLFNSLMKWATSGEGELQLRAFHINPMARALFHFNILAQLINLRSLDVYGGIVGGPSFYNVKLTVLDQTAARTSATFLVGPTFGLRYAFNDGRGFFVYGEARYLMEFGSTNFQLRASDGHIYSDNGIVQRGGRRMKVGVGFRF